MVDALRVSRKFEGQFFKKSLFSKAFFKTETTNLRCSRLGGFQQQDIRNQLLVDRNRTCRGGRVWLLEVVCLGAPEHNFLE